MTAALVIALMILSAAGCELAPRRYTYEFLDTFDTWVQITATADSRESFEAFAQDFHERMRSLHRLFDIYYEYDGLNNARTVNENAGIAPVAVDPPLIDLLGRCKAFYAQSGGAVDVSLGAVLAVWHEARMNAQTDLPDTVLPSREELEALRSLGGIGDVILDTENGTAYLAREGMRLDLGAAAKGYAVEVALREADAAGISACLISAGGNVVASDAPDGGWSIGLLDPFAAETGGELLAILTMDNLCAVTSGDYQRYFEIDGVRYGHIVDPETLWPARNFTSVTIIGPSSCDADFLSTALFVLPLDEGRELALSMGYDAVWIGHDGVLTATDGALALMKEP